MTGPEHYTAGEEWLAVVETWPATEEKLQPAKVQAIAAMALAHFTAALAAPVPDLIEVRSE